MNNNVLFDLPNKLEIIFDKLNNYSITTIIVGGYVRDKFLNLESKDIDIELYGVKSLHDLEKILRSFGILNCVGKSFGVYKLSLDDLDLDFTLPRRDNKIASGHCGFEIIIDNNLDFESASLRRDFTINTIGYDTQKKMILDPCNGLKDLEDKILKAVDLNTFGEDPLRVLRAVGFSSRFNFRLDDALFSKCKKMCEENILSELPSERIYGEVKKMILKSVKISDAFLLLQKLNALKYFPQLHHLSQKDFSFTLSALDALTRTNIKSNKLIVILSLVILSSKLITSDTQEFITQLTNDKKLLQEVLSILRITFVPSYTDSQLYILATQVNIENFLYVSEAIHKDIDSSVFQSIKKRSMELGILHTKAKEYLQGRDLIDYGLEPSPEFAKILALAYKAQIGLEINSHPQAKVWLENYLKNQ